MPVQTGSRRYFMYTADNGSEYAVELDESIYETTTLGFQQLPAQRDVIGQNSTRPLSMRKVNCVRVEGTQTERATFFVGSSAAYVALQTSGSVTVDGDEWNISSFRGEQRKIVPATDTESLDGDVDDNLAVALP